MRHSRFPRWSILIFPDRAFSLSQMEMLEGEILEKAAEDRKIDYNHNFIRRETWMQLQDVLTGQIDRHGDNVMLTKDGPVAIDHEFSFPTNSPRGVANMVPDRIVTRPCACHSSETEKCSRS
jgi:hypothetical protein